MSNIGYVMGDEELVGDDDMVGYVMGDEDVVGARGRAGALVRLPPRPAWRRGQVAPGVAAPREYLLPMPMQTADGSTVATFDATVSDVTMIAEPQKPYRGERLVAIVARTAGAVGQIIVASGIFVGTDPQQTAFGATPIDVFAPTAFGVRMVLDASQPGIKVRVPMRVEGAAIPAGESITVSLVWFGRAIQ